MNESAPVINGSLNSVFTESIYSALDSVSAVASTVNSLAVVCFNAPQQEPWGEHHYALSEGANSLFSGSFLFGTVIAVGVFSLVSFYLVTMDISVLDEIGRDNDDAFHSIGLKDSRYI